MFSLNLRLFDGGAGAGGAAGGEGGQGGPAAAPEGIASSKPGDLSKVQYGKAQEPTGALETKPDQPKAPETVATTESAEARRAQFEQMIRGDYKDLFAERTQSIIDQRFKQTKGLQEQSDALQPVLSMLASKYGVDAADTKALAKALTDDQSFYEDAAAQMGMTVEQYKQFKTMETENAQFKRMMADRERQEKADQLYSKWTQDGEALKGVYSRFDLRSECNHPETGRRFMGLLQSGVDVKTAYEVLHKDEILAGAMQYTAQQVRDKTVKDIAARGARPTENGSSGQAPALLRKSDVGQLSRADRDEISRRALRGDRISF